MMSDNQSIKGFTGAFTWENVGQQIANGLISGGASFAMGMLLDGLFAKKENMGDMFQKFADQIVERLSVKMREIVDTAFFKDNMQELINRSRSLETQYRAYLLVEEQNLLDDMEEDSFEINQKAMSLQMPAIGIFCIQKVIQIAIFEEKKKFNSKYQQLIEVEINDADKYIQDMHRLAIHKIDSAFVYDHKTQYGMDGEMEASWGNVYYEGKLLGVVDKLGKHGNPLDSDGKSLGTYKFEKYQQLEKDIINPARLIINKLKENIVK